MFRVTPKPDFQKKKMIPMGLRIGLQKPEAHFQAAFSKRCVKMGLWFLGADSKAHWESFYYFLEIGVGG